MKQVRLNRLEIWIADHAAPIFIVVAALIVAGAVAITVVFLEAQEAGEQVNVLKPQVTRVNKAICDKQSLSHPQRAERCAERIRVGLVNCRRSQPCRAAFLAVATYPPPADATAPSSTTAITAAPTEKGGATQQPSDHGHQQPGPDKGPQGGDGGNGGGDQGDGQGAAPAPSPGASGGEGGSGAGQGQESPGNGAQGSQGGESSSGVGVELCALERTCVDVEVGVDPKGLLP